MNADKTMNIGRRGKPWTGQEACPTLFRLVLQVDLDFTCRREYNVSTRLALVRWKLCENRIGPHRQFPRNPYSETPNRAMWFRRYGRPACGRRPAGYCPRAPGTQRLEGRLRRSGYFCPGSAAIRDTSHQ